MLVFNHAHSNYTGFALKLIAFSSLKLYILINYRKHVYAYALYAENDVQQDESLLK